jgi:hypothetical protein
MRRDARGPFAAPAKDREAGGVGASSYSPVTLLPARGRDRLRGRSPNATDWKLSPSARRLDAEPGREYTPHCRDERAATGEEYVVDLTGRDALPFEQPVDSLFDAGDVLVIQSLCRAIGSRAAMSPLSAPGRPGRDGPAGYGDAGLFRRARSEILDLPLPSRPDTAILLPQRPRSGDCRLDTVC